MLYKTQALTYDFNGNLESSSKGVALDAQWGGGSYSGEWYGPMP